MSAFGACQLGLCFRMPTYLNKKSGYAMYVLRMEIDRNGTFEETDGR